MCDRILGAAIDALPQPWRTVTWMTLSFGTLLGINYYVFYLEQAKKQDWLVQWSYMTASLLVVLAIAILSSIRVCSLTIFRTDKLGYY
jgi:hypothetical protein